MTFLSPKTIWEILWRKTKANGSQLWWKTGFYANFSYKIPVKSVSVGRVKTDTKTVFDKEIVANNLIDHNCCTSSLSKSQNSEILTHFRIENHRFSSKVEFSIKSSFVFERKCLTLRRSSKRPLRRFSFLGKCIKFYLKASFFIEISIISNENSEQWEIRAKNEKFLSFLEKIM